MPQTKIDQRGFSERRKCDVPDSNFVTFVEVKDESSPECSPPLNGFFRSGQTSKSGVSQDICNGRKTEDNASHSALSVLSNHSNQENTTRNCDLDFHSPNLLNDQHLNIESNIVENQNNCDRKCTLFSDSLLNSLTCETNKEDSMKIINDSVSQDFSDLLSSISVPDHESRHNSKLCFTNFEVSDSHEVNNELRSYIDYIGKPNGFSTHSKGTLSDILSSISFDEHDSSQAGNKISSNSNQCFTTNQIPILNKLDSEISTQIDSETNNGTLSDILSAISFDIDTSVPNWFLSSSNSSLSLNGIETPISKLDASDLESSGNLSDMLSSIDFHDDNTALKSAAFFSSNPSQDFESDSLFNLNEISSKFLNSDDKVKSTSKPTDDEIFSFSTALNNTSNNIKNGVSSESYIGDYTFAFSNITPQTSNHNKFPMIDENNKEFSFFSASPDNVFSAMLSNLSKTSDSQDKNTNEHSAEISMLDLLKSINTDSNSSLSEYLSMPCETTDKDAVDTVLDEILNIDLSACIKTDGSINTLRHELPVNKICTDDKNNIKIKLEGSMKPVFDNIDSNCPKPPRMNLKQSLFSKSLSCKPKKNWILLKKVAQINSELYDHYFNHEDIKSKMDKGTTLIKNDTNNEMVICQTNDCMIRFKGRRLCPQEVH